jgi:predicted lipoprotein with Yx(FWY)xxD motif
MIRALVVAAGLTAAAVSLAGCGSSGGASSATGTAPAAVQPSASATGSASAGQGAGTAMMAQTSMLMVKKTSKLGAIVTDAKGYTVYRYAKDMKSMSMCTGACATKWMPLMPQGTLQGMGVSGKLISTITRSDGMKQLTLGGWPLYRYMGDAKPGQWKGQGLNSTWSAVTPAGKMSMGGMKMS